MICDYTNIIKHYTQQLLQRWAEKALPVVMFGYDFVASAAELPQDDQSWLETNPTVHVPKPHPLDPGTLILQIPHIAWGSGSTQHDPIVKLEIGD